MSEEVKDNQEKGTEVVAHNVANKEKFETLKERLKKGEELSDKEIDFVKYYKEEQSRKALDQVVRGVNDLFEKTYKFEEMNGKELTVKIRIPNALEQGRINGLRETMLGGMGSTLSTYLYQVYTFFATLEVCGVDVPKELKPENMYNVSIAYKIQEDFMEYMNSFRA